MDIKFENLAKIDEILELLKNQQENKIEKRWLNVSETAHYLGYSKDHIHKMKNDTFILDLHYYKKSGRLLFDRVELDKWVTTTANKLNPKDIANDILKDLI
ncbi:MAG: helix-turn-helix domain-containing protein [Campylobacterota bacterium]|nr:helix-turn-helix domain-containing protein [Campylobacterota bacterium]